MSATLKIQNSIDTLSLTEKILDIMVQFSLKILYIVY